MVRRRERNREADRLDRYTQILRETAERGNKDKGTRESYIYRHQREHTYMLRRKTQRGRKTTRAILARSTLIHANTHTRVPPSLPPSPPHRALVSQADPLDDLLVERLAPPAVPQHPVERHSCRRHGRDGHGGVLRTRRHSRAIGVHGEYSLARGVEIVGGA